MPPHCRAILVCDDLRTEVGNKISAVGMYNDLIGFPPGEGPMGLPKLAILFVVAGLRDVAAFRFRYMISFLPGPEPQWPPFQTAGRPDPQADEHNFSFFMMPAVFPGQGTVTAALDVEVDGITQRFEHTLRVIRGAPGAAAIAMPGRDPNRWS